MIAIQCWHNDVSFWTDTQLSPVFDTTSQEFSYNINTEVAMITIKRPITRCPKIHVHKRNKLSKILDAFAVLPNFLLDAVTATIGHLNVRD